MQLIPWVMSAQVLSCMEKNVYTALCDFIPFLYAGALCHGLYHFMLYVFGKGFMPGSVRDGLTRKRKRKEKRNHDDLCKAA